ncbi:MAG: hypothetical protein JSR47_19360 [Proteobacteria bacterium]|nr:hypothetical protein [Pseudomonadota bacterium]
MRRPYRFERLIAIALALAFALVIAGVAVHLSLQEKLPLYSPRGWYFLYLGALVVLVLALARWPKATLPLLSLLALEVGIGFGSAALYRNHWSDSSLFPRTAFAAFRMRWHPMLQAVPAPSPPDPDTLVVLNHNSAGLRGRERTADELRARTVIALFGGSTTYDPGASEGESWPDLVEQALGADRYAVLNHGVPAYTTVENLLQTAFYQNAYGVRPRCAVYYVGWNDVRNSHVRGLDPAYADFHLPNQVDELQTRRIGSPYLAVSPTLSFLMRLVVLAVDTSRPAPNPEGRVSALPDPALEAIYADHLRSISAINRGRGVATVWIGQVMNRAELAENRFDSWIPFVEDKDVWSLVARLNALAQREAAALGDTYIDIPVDRFDGGDFVDLGHFTPSGSRKFAAIVAPALAAACR